MNGTTTIITLRVPKLPGGQRFESSTSRVPNCFADRFDPAPAPESWLMPTREDRMPQAASISPSHQKNQPSLQRVLSQAPKLEKADFQRIDGGGIPVETFLKSSDPNRVGPDAPYPKDMDGHLALTLQKQVLSFACSSLVHILSTPNSSEGLLIPTY